MVRTSSNAIAFSIGHTAFRKLFLLPPTVDQGMWVSLTTIPEEQESLYILSTWSRNYNPFPKRYDFIIKAKTIDKVQINSTKRNIYKTQVRILKIVWTIFSSQLSWYWINEERSPHSRYKSAIVSYPELVLSPVSILTIISFTKSKN